MFRTLTALGLLTVLATNANAQRHGGSPLPLSPGVMQGSSIGPGTQFLPQATPRFVPSHGFGGGTTQYVRPNVGVGFNGRSGYGYGGSGYGYGGYGFSYGYGGYGYGYGYGGYGYGGYGYDGYDFGPIFLPPPLPRAPTNIVLANEFPATLTVQLPTGDNPKEVVMTSPVLKPGEQHTFAVNVRWTSGGKTYEAKRSVTLGAGDRSRLFIVSGDEVKE